MKVVKALKELKEIELPMDAHYYDRLHDKIMMQIDRPRTPLRPSPWYEKPVRSIIKRPWRSTTNE